MKIIAFNGSPRKSWNTATLLEKALEGAASKGAETELINLYDLNYKGCASCFACKKIGSKSYGKCALKDDLTPILDKIEEADGIILGSPIYLGSITGEMKSFLERLIFPYLVYDADYSSLFKKKINTAFIYTMGIDEQRLLNSGYDSYFNINKTFLEHIFGNFESLILTDAYQFDDYSKYVSSAFDPEKKAQRRQEQFPIDCEKAFELGVNFATAK
ncbi:flavodoxin family protein [Clostridium pasteurianum]|uniref:Multimeric flavodoxin WrbA n=1 Tax=Clostridium pasteurianum BC1 TaxID=86416 RepID=R4K1N9_CLOPA|nr:flavodoxin family protein [Clostridium pasteurianum]AGK95696.1 multimeric flavodoxin WrbA [Clostridium pasteurianum BC1]